MAIKIKSTTHGAVTPGPPSANLLGPILVGDQEVHAPKRSTTPAVPRRIHPTDTAPLSPNVDGKRKRTWEDEDYEYDAQSDDSQLDNPDGGAVSDLTDGVARERDRPHGRPRPKWGSRSENTGSVGDNSLDPQQGAPQPGDHGGVTVPDQKRGAAGGR